jgi:cytoskeletal protein CcmA (bactofilin family)
MKGRKEFAITLLIVLAFASLALAGTPEKVLYGLRVKDEGAAHSTPPSGYGDLYVNSDALYFITDGGVATNLLAATTTAWDDIGAPDSAATIAMTTFGQTLTSTKTNGDMFNFQGLGNFGDVSVVRIESKTGNPTDGTVLEVVSHDADVDPFVVSTSGQAGAFKVNQDGTVSIIGNTGITGDLSVSGSLTYGTLYQSAIASAASGNTNLTINAAGTGTITVGGTSTGATIFPNTVTMTGNVDIGNAATDTLTITSIIDSNVTLDDGTTDSPSLILKDATDETATFKKTDGANLDLTTAATEGLRVMVGNLRVGDGSPGTAAMDGKDAYIEGQLEVDGSIQLDGAVTAASSLAVTGTSTLAGNLTLDDNSGASPSLTFTDATNETAIFSKADAGFLSVTTVAGDGFSVLTGNFKVGGGTPDVAQDGEDVYVTGTFETDGASRFDGAVTLGDASADDITITGSIASDVVFKTGLGGGADISVATAGANTAGSTLDLVAGSGGTAGVDQVGKNGAILSVTGGAGSAKNGAGANDGDGGDIVLLGGARGGTTGGSEVQGIVRVGNPTVGSIKTTDLLAVAGGFEVDGNAKFDGNITGYGGTIVSGTLTAVADSGAGPDNLTAAQCGGTFYNSQANQSNLPEASTVIGCQYTFVVTNASNYDINPDDADILLGATDAPGDMIRSATVGDSVTLRAISASQWAVVSMYPASTDWTDAN